MSQTIVKAEEFKDSPLGMIPKDWEVVTLSSLFHIQSGTTPLRSKFQSYFANATIPWVKTTDLNEGWIFDTDECITEAAVRECSLQLLPAKTIVVAMYGGWEQIGRTGILKLTATTNQAISSLVKISNVVEPEFVLRALQHERNRWKGIAASTRKDPNITKTDVNNFLIVLPSLSEQQRITEILDTVDESIARTESLIQKLKQMKAGLLHDLLTRGLDENGELRDAIAHPEQFKDSPLGKIPKDWDALPLKYLLNEKPKNGYSPKESDEWTGVVMLGLSCLTEDGFKPVQLKNAPRNDPKINNSLLSNGDLLLSRSNTRERVALAGIYKDINRPCIYPDLMMRLILNEQCYSRFLELLLRHPSVRKQLTNNAQGTSVSMVKISSKTVMETWIFIPSFLEQKKIIEKIDIYDNRIRQEEAYLDKFKQQKKGLMHDLLTGKVRVNRL